MTAPTCLQYISLDLVEGRRSVTILFYTSISNVCLSTAQSALVGTIGKKLLSSLPDFVC